MNSRCAAAARDGISDSILGGEHLLKPADFLPLRIEEGILGDCLFEFPQFFLPVAFLAAKGRSLGRFSAGDGGNVSTMCLFHLRFLSQAEPLIQNGHSM